MSDLTPRQHWMSVLSRASYEAMLSHWQSLGLTPSFRLIRPAEIGLVQIRARMGATGNPFNIGDVTMTRATLQLEDGKLGYGYVLGRNRAHAELAALLDALLQGPLHASLMETVVIPLAEDHASRRAERQRQIASSKVDFFTLRSE